MGDVLGAKRRPGTRLPRERQSERVERAQAIADLLAGTWPDADCELDWKTPWQLLIATILSAQCTDKMVNQVTPALFEACPDPAALAAVSPRKLEAMIRRTGFFKQKAKALRACARAVLDQFHGEVPSDLDALTTLPGVGRKTASVVSGTAFGKPAVFVDTHVRRLSGRLGLTRHQQPDRIEQDLRRSLPEAQWTRFCHRLIHHGRRVCTARAPACDGCALLPACPRVGVEGPARKKSASRSKR